MPLMDHLRELRSRLIKAILSIVAGTVLGFVFFEPIWNFLKTPYCRLPQSQQLNRESCTLVVNGVFDAFLVNLKVALIFGSSSPPRCGCTRSGRSSPRGCTSTSGATPCPSSASPCRCSSPARRSPTS